MFHMKCLFFLCLFVIISFPAKGERYVEDSLKIDGVWRKFVMLLPDGLQDDAPLVFVLHGHGGRIWKENPMAAPARRHGFALCIPLGLKDSKNQNSWNVGYPFQKGWKVNDVKTLCRMARYVQKRYKLSRVNTFLTGMSNGGEMCYLMAYSKQKTFRAVAPIAGLTMEWMYRKLEAPNPIPLMEVHGTEDRTSEWTGDLEDKGGWGAYMPVPIAVGYWVAKNRCTHEVTERVESKRGQGGNPVIKHLFTGNPMGCDVWLYEVVGGGHTWHTEDLDTGEEVWKFFSKTITSTKTR
jgi:polyhydroxybutyrate depolymerase